MQVVNLKEKYSQIQEFWSPRIAGRLNGQTIKLVKLKGNFIRHQHAGEDEFFLVIRGKLNIELDGKTLKLEQGEFVIIPRGVYHRPYANEEVEVLLFEPENTLNTGDQIHDLTVNEPDEI